jgi:hypothetical protein
VYKRDIINFLFLISFPVYGIGTYISATNSPSAGYFVSIFAHLLIILFYLIDMLYVGGFRARVNKYYYLMLLFVISTVASLFIALSNGLPEATMMLTVTRSVLLLVPIHAFLIVVLYNIDRRDSLVEMTLVSLSFLIAINLAGYFGLGLTNETHSLEGRLNFPFLGGFYSGASLLAVINLTLLYYMKRFWRDPIRFASLSLFFSFNLVLFFLINSRLSILVFLFVVGLSIVGLIRIRGMFWLSLFTIPILLSAGLTIYKIVQLPGLSSMMQRVDIEDVTTFNGRAFIWRDAMDWMLEDRQGFLFGNGYKGHYFLGLIDDVARMWNESAIYNMHLHSTSMEILICQGLFVFIIFALLLYHIYQHFRQMHREGRAEGAFFPVIIFLLFILQVDNFLYMDNIGFVIFSLLVAMIVLPEAKNKKFRLAGIGSQNLLATHNFAKKELIWIKNKHVHA